MYNNLYYLSNCNTMIYKMNIIGKYNICFASHMVPQPKNTVQIIF